MSETIFALSSGGLPSGVAVIRISGPRSEAICRELTGVLPPPRVASRLSIRTRNKESLDQGLVLYFQGPHSFTGEDCVEFQSHGGRAVVEKLLAELASFEQTRHADAGEFTKRAFENGKLDLVQAEGLADLIAADTEMQRRLAVEQSSGGLSAVYDGWARRLTHARAMIEAELDFADEDDVPGSVSDAIWADMQILVSEIDTHLQSAATGEIIRDGLKVAIIGPPNAGKSSLLNQLAKRDVAIVTDRPGTTRDVLTTDINLDGFVVRFYDTAGLRETEEVVEVEGIRRARLAAAEADYILCLHDMSEKQAAPLDLPQGVPLLHVGNKSDLCGNSEQAYDLVISAATGAGIAELREAIAAHLRQRVDGLSLAIPSRMRHVEGLRRTRLHLEHAVSSVSETLDIRAEYLRLASVSLGRITGRVDVETLLGLIFSEFCIGK